MPDIVKDLNPTFLSEAQMERLRIAQACSQKIIDDLAPVYIHETMDLYTAPRGILIPNGQVHVGKALQEIQGMYCTTQSQNLVLSHVKNMCVTSLADLEPPSDLIPVKNGAVSVLTGELVPYKKGMNFHGQFNIVYDPSARAPNFFKFLNHIQRDQIRRQRILNSFARCFDRTPMKRQAELYIGEPDTGKTTLLRVLRYMLGQSQVASETLQSLTSGDDRWAIGNLFHKAANINAELRNILITELGKFKTLTGGDPVTAEFKGKPKFEFIPYVKFFFACNYPPKIEDDELKEDLAFFERFFITYFDVQIPPEDRDESLVMEDRPEESLLVNQREISGLFNVCLGILHDIRSAKNFRYLFNGVETREIWFHEYAPNKKVDDFLAAFTVQKADGSIQVSEFEHRINEWLRKKNKEQLTSQQINPRMEEKFGKQGHGTKKRLWRGVAWKDQDNESLFGVGKGNADQTDQTDNRLHPFIYVQSEKLIKEVSKYPSDPSSHNHTETVSYPSEGLVHNDDVSAGHGLNGTWVQIAGGYFVKCDSCKAFLTPSKESLTEHLQNGCAGYCPDCKESFGPKNGPVHQKEKHGRESPRNIFSENLSSISLDEIALKLFRQLCQSSKEVKGKIFTHFLSSTGRFSDEEADEKLAEMWHSGVITEVSAGVYIKA